MGKEVILAIASQLSRFPRDVSTLVVKVKGKDNTINVRRQKVLNALLWLHFLQYNPHYTDTTVDNIALRSLSENGIPHDTSVSDEPDGPDVSSPK